MNSLSRPFAEFQMKFPCILNSIGIAATAGANALVWFHVLEGILAFISLLFGAVTAVFTALIAVRRWRRGFRLEQQWVSGE